MSLTTTTEPSLRRAFVFSKASATASDTAAESSIESQSARSQRASTGHQFEPGMRRPADTRAPVPRLAECLGVTELVNPAGRSDRARGLDVAGPAPEGGCTSSVVLRGEACGPTPFRYPGDSHRVNPILGEGRSHGPCGVQSWR